MQIITALCKVLTDQQRRHYESSLGHGRKFHSILKNVLGNVNDELKSDLQTKNLDVLALELEASIKLGNWDSIGTSLQVSNKVYSRVPTYRPH